MKRKICLLVVLLLLLCGCSQSKQPTYDTNYTFTTKENGNLISTAGTEYKHLAYEGILYYLGELDFAGGVQGEVITAPYSGLSYQTGMFAIKGSQTDNILIRRMPDNEWFAIYRKASLPEFDFSADNCTRLEFVAGSILHRDSSHINCQDGITDKSEIAAFLLDVQSQKSPEEAGLYDMVKKPDGMLENCYLYGYIYGFFPEEPNIVFLMEITSYNDLAYSIDIGQHSYVLPESWLQKLQPTK